MKLFKKNNKKAPKKDAEINFFQNLKSTVTSMLQRSSGTPIQQDVIGLDISNDYVRAVQLTEKNDKWIVTKASFKSLNASENEEVHHQALVSTIRTIKAESKFDTENVAVCIPVNSAIVQVLTIPYLEDNELQASVDNGSLWENQVSLPGDINEYSIFWQTVKKDKERNELVILFVASRLDEIEKYSQIVREGGLDPIIVDVRCFALRNITKINKALETKTSAFVEISGDENYAVFVHDDLPFIYDIFVSDNDINAINNGGDALTDDVFTRITAQIRNAITSFIKQSDSKSLEEINISSSLSNFNLIFKGIKKEMVDYKTKELNPFDNVVIPENLKEKIEANVNQSSLSVSMGLATRKLDVFGYYQFVKAVSNINLLPNRNEVIKKEENKIKSSKISKLVALISSSVAGLLFLASTYAAMIYPNSDELDLAREKISVLEADFNNLKQKYEMGINWRQQTYQKNIDIMKTDFLSRFPKGTSVQKLVIKRKGESKISIKAKDPRLAAGVIEILSEYFKNVAIKDVDSEMESNLTTTHISFEMK